MTARVVKYHSIAEWNFSLWFALQRMALTPRAIPLSLCVVRNAAPPSCNVPGIDFYTGARHEMLHEINRRDVITNLLVWMSSIVERSS